MNTQLRQFSFQFVHFKIDSHFSLLPAYILLISYKNDKVFSLSITDVCGLPHVTFMGYPSRSTLMRAGRLDDTTPLCRNQLQATQSACLHLATHRPDDFSGGTGENAPAKRPTTPASAHFAGVRLHYPGAVPGRCVRRFLLLCLRHC